MRDQSIRSNGYCAGGLYRIRLHESQRSAQSRSIRRYISVEFYNLPRPQLYRPYKNWSKEPSRHIFKR